LIVGIDRFMSEARAVTNFSGNAVATLLVGSWTNTIDNDRVRTVLDGKLPFDESTMVDDGHGEVVEEPATKAPAASESVETPADDGQRVLVKS
ncbi:C4-dicarboxylate transporter DctA, partial [Rhodococcus koreensis]